VGTRAGLEAVTKTKKSLSLPGFELWSSSPVTYFNMSCIEQGWLF